MEVLGGESPELETARMGLGMLRSSMLFRVSSRLFLVWGVCYPFDAPIVRENWAFSTMVAAWGIAEVIRYTYYALNITGSKPVWLLWCRYNFFLVLYPIGAGSEWILLLKVHTPAYAMDTNLSYLFGLIGLLYPHGLKRMYCYMMDQREKYLNSPAAVPVPEKEE
ncbi:protein-tyrosine phosphatase-like protein [Blyttiomyces helicus]|uniref:Very-long-chain (3R)-3-hydroxyacyl-CoA dehydratase n=1 Tax=Blyttiomyces helicus TaxID=388810 RepID=A0A4P9WLF1_9FUNG|nr:protein-tyrosine phosphatase-like protein [Blyttiomyces helicus]|eukprot:RKO93861.1 protein-tyrosine phosphatase-like protein [Blyttiomyces helicus]